MHVAQKKQIQEFRDNETKKRQESLRKSNNKEKAGLQKQMQDRLLKVLLPFTTITQSLIL